MSMLRLRLPFGFRRDKSKMPLMFRLLVLLNLLVRLLVRPVTSYAIAYFCRESSQRSFRRSRRYLLEDEDSWIGEPDGIQELSLHKELQDRKEQLRMGIGKRFVVNTQKGFLNVHSSMDDGPYATDNIVRQLHEGDVVTSKNITGYWIQHDHGWSVAEYGGFVFLKPVDE